MINFLLSPILTATVIGGGVAIIMGAVILTVFHYFSVEKDALQQELEGILPGVNCGGCGYSGCAAYSTALAEGAEKNTGLCTAGGQETATAVAAALGVKAGAVVPLVANVFCQGTREHTHERYTYTGTPHCASANGLFSGPNSCTFGCLGFGDCVEVC
ncbi:MAG TPA: (Fe-S)-binding protein, partial [Bacillota bacterium]|nr:(Fe-S)-binding protein [Bacillota bacterium]